MTENPHLDKGMLWLERNRPERAEPELRQAVASEPDDADCRARLALCLAQLDKYREALAEAENAIGLDPEWDFPYFVRAIALAGLGRARQAEGAAREAIEMDPESSSYRGLLANILAHQKRWKESLEAAEAGLEVDPEDESCASARAMALIQLGRAKEADLAMESALRKNPEDAKAHALMGWSTLHKGRAAEAVDHYAEALKLDPASEVARAGLVESLKARNFLYRAVLRYFILLTRIKARWVFAIMIGSVIVRQMLLRLAESAPAVAPVVWPVFYLMVGFVLMTWVAVPVFNLLLRFDRVGRHALSRVDIRQSNWLAGCLAAVAFLLVLYLAGLPAMGMATVFCAMMIIPVVTTARKTDARSLLLLGGYTLLLAGLGAYTVYEAYSYGKYLDTLEQAGLYDDDSGMIDFEKAKDTPVEEQRRIMLLFKEWLEKRKAQRETTESLVMYFVIGWVAFSWFANFVKSPPSSDD
jgi:tetratricopeptide (TPR) repeat protein